MTLQAWYADRPEVLTWQENTKKMAKELGYVRTMMGRYRNLPDARSRNYMKSSHALRAAINTPIQVCIIRMIGRLCCMFMYVTVIGQCGRYCYDGND